MEKQIELSVSYDGYERQSHSVGISIWQFEWCPKYRYKMMKNPEKRALVQACIRRAASIWKIGIIEINVQPDHVHLTAKIPMTMTPSDALHKLKGNSAKKIFEMVPNFRLRYRKGHFWSRGKFAASLGMITVEAANEYVRSQDKHHKTRWF
jgi:putative transposase